jgi:anti-sigma regulatory factor (Ser/Thr protein kinase)
VKELTVDAVVNNIEVVTDFVNEELDKHDCLMKARMQIDVAIDELFGNIAHYAYDNGTGSATVRIEVTEEPLAVILTFIDSGKPFNPLERPEPDTTLSAQERAIGGLGIFLVKKTMDEVVYRYEDGHNILSIKKMLR